MSEMDPRKSFPYPSMCHVCKQEVSFVYAFALFQPKDDFFVCFLFTSSLDVYFR